MNGIEKLIADLKWRGPNDKPMGHIVLTREQAESILIETQMLWESVAKKNEEILQLRKDKS